MNKKIQNIDNTQIYRKLIKLEKLSKLLNYRLYTIEEKVEKCIQDYEESKNAQLMIISRLENIADFLKHNYNVVIEERTKFNFNPHDD